ncbi:hypothetical protein FOMPIDRAFT_39266, partial [Fomitopsis schrenkii]
MSLHCSQDYPLREWAKDSVDEWLAELLRHEGRGDFVQDICAGCDSGAPRYRCEDCWDPRFYCEDCTRRRHRRNPFHRLKTWQYGRLRRATLKDLGLRIQLGHAYGDACPNPQKAFGDSFVVIDTSSLHEVGLDFCACTSAYPKHVQLLQSRLLPATRIDPKTASTFRLMEHYHLLHNQSKVSGYEFYNTLARRTNNTGSEEQKDRYVSFMRTARMWFHLKLLKRFGRGNDPGGVQSTKPGSCAVLCPACPHPGKNLPLDWATAPPERSWLYRLFVGLDANFRLKRRDVSSDLVDPGLNRGYAYFVEEHAYRTYLNMYDKDQHEDQSTCNSHNAVKLANMRGGERMAASGVGTVECVRHDMKRPSSVGDLQKGERYVNMDYLFASSLCKSEVVQVVVSYDIACQWSVNLWSRMTQYDFEFNQEQRTIIFLIPKFHLPAHQESCQIKYSYNYVKHVGRTDGEAVERGWAAVNGFSGSTKEMGPGSRRDVLDDAFGDYNWRKVVQLPKTLLQRVKNAGEERSKFALELRELTESTDAVRIAEWTTQVEAWENGSDYNPFEATFHPTTLASVRRALAEEDAAAIEANELTHRLHDEVTPSVMILAGIEVEEAQYVIRRQNNLRVRISAWREYQDLYMPAVSRLRLQNTPSGIIQPEDMSLYLPSSVVNNPSVPTYRALEVIEGRLRHAQANDALDQLRRHLRARSQLYNTKKRDVRGQRYNTRSQTYINIRENRP